MHLLPGTTPLYNGRAERQQGACQRALPASRKKPEPGSKAPVNERCPQSGKSLNPAASACQRVLPVIKKPEPGSKHLSTSVARNQEKA